MAFAFRRNESPTEGVRRVASHQLDSAIAELEGRAGRDLRQRVHSARKRGKRVRALLRLVRPELGEGYRRADVAVRDAGRALSPIRDAQALLVTFDALVAGAGEDRPGTGLAGVRAGLAQRAAAATERADGDGGATAEAAGLLTSVRTRLDHWTVGKGFDALAGGLGATYRRGRKGYRGAREAPSPEAFHEWRKATKHLWHQVQLLAPAAPSVLEPLAGALHDLADALGDDHDLAVLVEVLGAGDDGFGPAADVEAAVGLAEGRRADLEDRALLLGARLHVEKKKLFVRRLGGYWGAWQEHGDERPTGEITAVAPAEDDLDEHSRADLYERARQAGLPGRSSMSRADLLGSLRADDR